MTELTPNILLQMSETDRIKALELLSEIESRKKREAAQKDFLEFVKVMWPEFIHGSHHAKMAKAFERVVRGELKRLIINMPPRHTKSEFASNMLPAWFLGLYPHKQVMQISHTADMAEGFGRKVRNLVDSDVYNSVFPDTRLRRDSTAAARWNTDKNGVYIAMGVGGAVAGKGADLLIIDDPCLVEGTLVLTQYGLKEIQNITLEDKVWGRDGLYEVKALLTTRHDETTVINRNLTVSSNHPIWTTNRGWVAAKDLQTTDIMLTNRLPYNIMKFFLYLWRTTWLKVKQVTQQNQNTTFGQ